MFGVKPDPGVKFPYRQAFSYDKWSDDSASPLYNKWVDARHADPGVAPENMVTLPAYNYGAVIAYNTKDRTPHLGSAIFLHIGAAGPPPAAPACRSTNFCRFCAGWIRSTRR
jgi:L,D-peptidoglycan transpeptidase YkuD (ErfK/YbiS/YcfS/YnhG family)